MTQWITIPKCPIAEVSSLGTFRFKRVKTAKGILEEQDIKVKNGWVMLPTINYKGNQYFENYNALDIMTRLFLSKNVSYKRVTFKDRDSTNLSINNLIF